MRKWWMDEGGKKKGKGEEKGVEGERGKGGNYGYNCDSEIKENVLSITFCVS